MGQGEERGKSVERVGGRGGKRAQRRAAGKVVLEVYRRLNQNLRESFFLVQTNVSVAGVVLAV